MAGDAMAMPGARLRRFSRVLLERRAAPDQRPLKGPQAAGRGGAEAGRLGRGRKDDPWEPPTDPAARLAVGGARAGVDFGAPSGSGRESWGSCRISYEESSIRYNSEETFL